MQNFKYINKVYQHRYLNLLLIGIFFNVAILSKKNKMNTITRNKILYACKKYMQKCLKGVLLNNNSKIFSQNFKISAVVPVYNCEKTIKATIRSIQNQNMADIEIILVNDNSKDNTSKIIQQLAEEDRRIIILNTKF